MLDNLLLYSKPPHCRCPKGSPPVNGSPPAPRTRRARRSGSLKITQIVQHCGGGVVTVAAPAKKTPAPDDPALVARSHRANWPAFVTPAPALRCLADFGRVGGGQARCRSPGQCPHAADGPQTLRSGGRWLLSKCFPLIARRLLCAQAPHGWASYASWRHATNGARPLWIPADSVARRSRLTISLIAQQFAHGGRSSPTRSQARHVVWFASGLIIRFAIWQAVRFSFSLKNRAVSAR